MHWFWLIEWLFHHLMVAHHHHATVWHSGGVSTNPPPVGPAPGSPHCTPQIC